ncbi:MAG: ABC transporter ATP-binding protein [Halodesulfurarchaeum sp.]|nr:ABC transporter ATP-binding protein [Halodesulfurarchaeum sp.]
MSVEVGLQDQTGEQLLEVDGLDVDFKVKGGTLNALRNVSLELTKGETLGIAGESGSGKSTLALAIVQYLDNNARIPNGTIEFKGRDILGMSNSELKEIRGGQIAHVAQDASTALNPSMRIGEQIKESVELHQDLDDDDAVMQQVYEVLDQVNIPDPEEIVKRYPHELSGGQQQRALIAIGLSCNPEMLILDEPTTGLDVTTQAKLLDLIDDLKSKTDVGIIIITHNLAVIAQIADRVNILYAGEMMEKGPVGQVFKKPANPYTQALLATTPEIDTRKELHAIPGSIPGLDEIGEGCIFADRCDFAEKDCRESDIPISNVSADHETRCIHWETATADPIEATVAEERTWNPGETILEAKNLTKYYDEGSIIQRRFRDHKPVKALDGVDISVGEGETVGLVGESGCGKSTLGRTMLNLHKPTTGTVEYRGTNLSDLSDSKKESFHSECQIIFQDPSASLNPRRTVSQAIERPLKLLTDQDEEERAERIEELLGQVNLPIDLKTKYPHELSGGEQQRAAIARAFSANPSLVVLDEPVSSLDVSVQASILQLLMDLQDEYNTSYLLISHDMGVIRAVSDRLAVMYLGEIVEDGSLQDVFSPPFHPYTRSLLTSILSLDPEETSNRIRLEGDVPSARDPPKGCSFHTRCPQFIGEVCETSNPELVTMEATSDLQTHQMACHHEPDEINQPLNSKPEELNHRRRNRIK